MATINVTAGQSLQTAINNAQLGDMINIEAGAVFRGPLELPAKSGTGVIVIQSSRAGDLPQGRVSPSHAPLMPKILAPHADQALRTLPGAAHYKVDGIEFLPDPAATVMFDLVRFGGGRQAQTSLESVPHHLILDRCYVHGDSVLSLQRGVSLNSTDSEITRCYISQITGRGMDAQAIASWNTPGRNKITDCYLEATGENVMFGGADPASAEMIPSDIQMLRCTLVKPLAWNVFDRVNFRPLSNQAVTWTTNPKGCTNEDQTQVFAPRYVDSAGCTANRWVIKNLLEFKNGQRIQVVGCVFENNWGNQGQSGPAILLTTRNQEGTAPYSIVKEILFEHCTLKNSDGALNLMGTDSDRISQRGSICTVRNCLFTDIKGTFLLINGFDDLTIERTTHLQGGNTMVVFGVNRPATAISQRFIYRNNVTKENEYGIRDESGIAAAGKATLDMWMPGYDFTSNVMATPYGSNPAGNEYLTSLIIDAEFRTPYVGKGVDVTALLTAQAGTGTTVPLPTPIPSPTPVPIPPLPTPTPTPTPVPAKYGYESRPWSTLTSTAARATNLKLLNTMGAEGFRLAGIVGTVAYFEKTA
jgi:hypothetical protein